MAGVGPGTTIAGRYALRTIVHRAPRGQRWTAHDATTGELRSILLVPESLPVAQAVLDAGRLAATLDDPRLVRVLDHGTDQGYAYVVEERDEDARTLHDVLDEGPLAPEEARRVTGETAMLLERARQRGLHHEALSPDHVSLRRDGGIRVRGLAVDAALADAAADDGRLASRRDATALAGLLYAGLTATWPLGGSTLTPSPRLGRTFVPPSELASGVPSDLDEASLTGLAGRAEIPGDVVERLSPWAEGAVSRVVEAGPAADTEAPRSADIVDPSLLPDELRGDIEHPPSKAAVKMAAGASAVAAAAAASGRRSAEAAKAAAARAAAATAERRRETLERREAERASERSFTQLAREAPAEPERVVPVLAPDVVTAVPSRQQARFVLGLMAALLLVALVAGVLGVLSTVRNINDKVTAAAGATPTRTVTAAPVTVTARPGAPAPAPSATPTTTAAADIPVVGVTSYDPPPGDGGEHPETAARVMDGDDSTAWTSSKYATAEFSGIKQGVGLRLDLGQKAAVRTVTLVSPAGASGQDVSVYVTDEANPDPLTSQPLLGSTTVSGSTTTITVSGKPEEHQYVFVWFTKAAPSTGGKFAVSLAEVKLSS